MAASQILFGFILIAAMAQYLNSHRAGNIGEEINAAITGHESIDTLLADAKHRVNDLLSHIP